MRRNTQFNFYRVQTMDIEKSISFCSRIKYIDEYSYIQTLAMSIEKHLCDHLNCYLFLVDFISREPENDKL